METSRIRRPPVLDFVVPVYNEGSNIVDFLDRVGTLVTIPCRVLIVYDFPEDDTIPEVTRIRASMPFDIVLVRNTLGPGPLNAIRAGIAASSCSAVVVTMADGSDDLNDVSKMYAHFEQGADLVCASRYMPGGAQHGGPVVKRLLSRLAGTSLYALAGLPTRDATNNFKLYRRELLDAFPIESPKGFVFALEVTVKAFLGGFSIVEVPTMWKDRTVGRSRFALLTWIPYYWRWYWLALRTRGFGLHRSAPISARPDRPSDRGPERPR